MGPSRITRGQLTAKQDKLESILVFITYGRIHQLVQVSQDDVYLHVADADRLSSGISKPHLALMCILCMCVYVCVCVYGVCMRVCVCVVFWT